MRRTAFTLVELLVVITILAMLVALLLPAVQSAREAGRLSACKSNLAQIGLACLNFESKHGGLPPASMEPTWITNPATYGDGPRNGWVWYVLPYMEQNNIADQFHFDVPWFDPSLQSLIATRLTVMECPSDPIAGNAISVSTTDPRSGSTVTFHAAACDYFATVALNSNVSQLGFAPRQDETYTSTDNSSFSYLGALQDDVNTKLSEIRDGTSNTVLVAEMAGRPKAYLTGGFLNPNVATKTYGYGAWAHNDKHVVSSYTFDGLTSPGPCGINCSNQFAVYSFHPKGANVVFVDDSVHFLPQEMDEFVFFGLITRAGGEVIPGNAF